MDYQCSVSSLLVDWAFGRISTNRLVEELRLLDEVFGLPGASLTIWAP